MYCKAEIKPDWPHQGQIVPDKPGGLLWWSDSVSGQRKSNWCHLDFCKALNMVHATKLSYGFEGCHPKGSGYTWKVDLYDHTEVEQGQMQAVALASGQSES